MNAFIKEMSPSNGVPVKLLWVSHYRHFDGQHNFLDEQFSYAHIFFYLAHFGIPLHRFILVPFAIAYICVFFCILYDVAVVGSSCRQKTFFSKLIKSYGKRHLKHPLTEILKSFRAHLDIRLTFDCRSIRPYVIWIGCHLFWLSTYLNVVYIFFFFGSC